MIYEHPSRVLIVETGSILDGAIKKLIMGKPGLDVTTLTRTDRSAILNAVSKILPEVVFVSEGSEFDSRRISDLLHEILPEESFRLIVLHVDDNMLDVYDKHQMEFTHDEDLIDLIQHH